LNKTKAYGSITRQTRVIQINSLGRLKPIYKQEKVKVLKLLIRSPNLRIILRIKGCFCVRLGIGGKIANQLWLLNSRNDYC